MPLIPPNQDRDDVIRAVAELLDCSYIDEVPTAAENDRMREVAVTAREALDRIVARALAAEADAARLRAHIDAAGDGANLPALLDLYHDRAERAFADAARWRKVAPLIGALGAPDEHAAHTATWLALTSAITSALAAAREAGRREVLEGAAGVEEAIRDLVVAARDVESHSEEMTMRRRHVQAVEGLAAAQDAIRLAIAADKARAVEAASDAAFDRGRAATIKYADGLVMRPVLSREDAEWLVNVLIGSVVGAALDAHTSPSINAMAIDARAALLAALTGAGGGK